MSLKSISYKIKVLEKKLKLATKEYEDFCEKMEFKKALLKKQERIKSFPAVIRKAAKIACRFPSYKNNRKTFTAFKWYGNKNLFRKLQCLDSKKVKVVFNIYDRQEYGPGNNVTIQVFK